MFESIRRRLTLGYIGIFALILAIIGAVVVASFAHQAASQQDELLEQKARGDADYVAGPLLHRYQEGRYSGEQERRGGPDGGPPPGPFQWAMDPDLGMAALVPGESEGGGADGEGSTLIDSTSSAS